MSGPRAALLGLALALAATTLGARARAEASAPTATTPTGGSRVVLVGDARDPEVAALLSRLRGELGAAGFDVETAPAGAGDARASVEGADPGAFASVHVARAQGGVDVWIADRATGKTSVRRVAGKSPAEVALQVVELLRASLAELSLPEAPRPATPVSADVARFASAPIGARSPSGARGVSLEIGASAFLGRGAWVGPSLALAVHHDWLRVGLSLDGPGFGPAHERDAGRARATPTLGLLEVALRLPRDGRGDRAFALGLGAGALYVRATGEASAPYRGQEGSAWALTIAPSIEGRQRLSGGLWLTLGARLVLATPAPTVSIDGATVTALGRPTALLHLGLAVTP